MKKPLSPKARRFAEEYLVDLCATKAAIRAGYSPRGANVTAHQLLQDPRVAKVVESGRARLAQRTEVTQERVIRELAAIAFHDVRKLYCDDGTIKAPHDLDDETAAAFAGLENEELFEGRGNDRVRIGTLRKVKRWDKTKALELLARHFGMLKDPENTPPPGTVVFYLPKNGRDGG